MIQEIKYSQYSIQISSFIDVFCYIFVPSFILSKTFKQVKKVKVKVNKDLID